MTRMTLIAAAAALFVLAGAPAASAPRSSSVPRPDLADVAAGTYHGNVISDSRGAGQSDVTITVVKAAPNTVTVSSSYARLPTFTVKLTRAMQTIQQVGTIPQAGGGSIVFLLDLANTPHHLDVTDDEASWSGSKE